MQKGRFVRSNARDYDSLKEDSWSVAESPLIRAVGYEDPVKHIQQKNQQD